MRFYKLRNILLLSFIGVTGMNVFAQSDLSSPYSRFGLGDINTSSPNTILKGMGGISNAMADPYLLNPNNPASYTSFDSLSFLFDASLYIKTVTYSSSNMSEKGSNASFEYASVGFSATKWWKTGFGIMPYSNREYNVITDQYNSETGAYKVSFEGSGGLNRVFFANGFKVIKNLSLGVNLSYIFGTLKDITSVYYPDSIFFINGKRTIDMKIDDFKLDYGLIYSLPIKNDYMLNVGITYSQISNLSSTRNIFIRNMFKGYENFQENPIDTLKYIRSEKIRIKIPNGFGAGVTLKKGNQWIVGADFNWNGWKDFEINGSNDSLQNSWKIALGGSYKPKSTSISGYLKKMTYRAGFHYDQTYYRIYDHSINKYGITLGVGLPLPRSLTIFNIAIEFGEMGTIKSNLIKETYFNISAEVSIYDKWFIKKKYK